MKFTKIREVRSPERANHNDSWIDFYIPKELWQLRILPWENIKIPLWVKILLPEWFDFTFVNKSGIASKTWLITWACLVDNWYRWELVLNLINTSKFEVKLQQEQKIIQWVIRKVDYMLPEEIYEDEYIADTILEGWRWDWGFWSTWL
jgi:dUTPase